MERVSINENSMHAIENILVGLDEDHSSSRLNALKTEINRIFPRAKCTEVLYTINTDKLFFGMKVYPIFDGNEAIEIIAATRPKTFEKYAIEFDSKLFDLMLCLDQKELAAIMLHEIGHIVYDVGTIDEVKKNIDMYFAQTNDSMDSKLSKGYKELLAYALKDAVVKAGSIFAKMGDTEIVADTFVASCGYGPYLESAMRKISASSGSINRGVDDRFIALSWVLRLKTEFSIRRIPAIKTLNKAKQLSASKLEQKELNYAVNIIQRSDVVSEGVIDDMRNRFTEKFKQFKVSGVRSMRDDIYEMNVELRTAEDPEDLMRIIRKANTDISILQDYLSEDISDAERKATQAAIEELWDIRQRAAKDKQVRDRYSSMINVVYPNM